MRRKDLRFGKTNFYLLFFVPIIYFICMSENVFAGVVIVDENKRNLVDDHSGSASKNIDMDDVKIPIVVDLTNGGGANITDSAVSMVQDSTAARPPIFYHFEITPGQTIHNALVAFAMNYGWQVAWEIDEDYIVETSAVIEGDDLEKVMNTFGQSLSEAIGRMVFVKIYDGNKVLRVVYYK